MSENTTNEGYMIGKLMQFPRSPDIADPSHEGYCLVEVVEVVDGFAELAWDSEAPKRRNYLRVRLSDLHRAVREVTTHD